jgi:hypothetical protein
MGGSSPTGLCACRSAACRHDINRADLGQANTRNKAHIHHTTYQKGFIHVKTFFTDPAAQRRDRKARREAQPAVR